MEGLKAALGLQKNFSDFEVMQNVSAACPRRLRCNRIKRFVDSFCFDLMVLVVIFCNAVVVGIETDIVMSQQLDRLSGIAVNLYDTPTWFESFKIFVVVLFALEVFLRILADECEYFVGPAWMWNWMDLVLLLAASVGLGWQQIGVTTMHLRTLRVLRLPHLLRIFKSSSAVQELRCILTSVSTSFGPLVLTLMLIALFTYACAVTVMSNLANNLSSMNSADPDLISDLGSSYGTLSSSFLALVSTLTGAKSWSQLGDPLLKVSLLGAVLLGLYGIFITLGMLNVITGIFVQSVDRATQMDHQRVIAQEFETAGSRTNLVRLLLAKQKPAGLCEGIFTIDTLLGCAKRSELQSFLSFFGLSLIEACGVFKILDQDGDGSVQIDEFLLNCMRLSGPSKGVDICTLMAERKRMTEAFHDYVSPVVQGIERLTGRIDEISSQVSRGLQQRQQDHWADEDDHQHT